jgi:GDP-L-fucose synthase
MNLDAKIYIAGHRGLVGSALLRALQRAGYQNLLLRTHAQLDLENALQTDEFFAQHKPQYVLLAAARVGGIAANNDFPADFIVSNLAIELNCLRAAQRHGVKRLLFLGSSCIYPKFAEQPIREDSLLTGPLEPTNRPYALAKIAGIELCWSMNRQHGTHFLAAMPTNLYGPGDNYDLNGSHVLPALIRKFHEAKVNAAPQVVVWGSGKPLREFLHSDDLAAACLYLLQLDDSRFVGLLGNSTNQQQNDFAPPLINIGSGQEVSIAQLATMVGEAVGYRGAITYDASKPDGTPRKLMDSSLMRALGWQPAVSFENGLRDTYALFLRTVA